MNKSMNLALIAALGMLTGPVALAQPSADGPGPRRQAQERTGPGRPDPEIRKQALLKKYDTNQDGKLDDTERVAIGKDVEEGTFDPRLLGVRPGGSRFGAGPRGPQTFGGPGFGPRHEEMLERYDVNKDGRLDETERAVIRKDIEDGKLDRPRFGPGRRGFGPPPGTDAPDGPPPGEVTEE